MELLTQYSRPLHRYGIEAGIGDEVWIQTGKFLYSGVLVSFDDLGVTLLTDEDGHVNIAHSLIHRMWLNGTA